jgi:DNA primase
VARIAEEDIDRVRDATDFAALVEQRCELERGGAGSYMCLCPFHDERTPSMSIKPDDKLFHCFGCGEGGNVFKWVELTEGVDFTGAVELLADRAGIQLKTPEEDPETAARRAREKRLLELLDRTSRFYERQLWESQEGADARRELQRRGLDPDLLKAFRVGYSPRRGNPVLQGSQKAGYAIDELLASGAVQRGRDGRDDLYDRFRRRIMFPLADRRGRIMGFGARALDDDQKPKYINSSDGVVYRKGRHLFAAHIARRQAARTGEVILCEGYTDVIALHQAGLSNAVGLMGTALTPEQIVALGKLAPSVILALDADRAGREAMLRAAQLAAGSGLKLRVVLMPDGMDPADLMLKRGPEALTRAFAEPMALGRFHVGHVLDQADLTTSEGKDRAIEALRPVFAQQPPGVLHMELMQHAAGRLRLDPTALQSLIENTPAAPAPPQPDQRRGGGAGGPGGGRPVGSGGDGGGGRPGGSGGRGPGGDGRQSGGGAGRAPGGWSAGDGRRSGGDGWRDGGRSSSGPGTIRPPVPVRASSPGGVDAVARAELSFLAECWAAGPDAAQLLDDHRIRTQMGRDAHRSAAVALRDALRNGAERPLPPDDSTRMMLDVVLGLARAIEHPSTAAAELRGLELELSVVREELRSGRSLQEGGDHSRLVLRRMELEKRIDVGAGEIWKGPRRTA